VPEDALNGPVTPSYLKKAEYAMPDNRHNSGADPPPPLEQVLDRLDALERKLDALRTEQDSDALLTEQEAADLLGVMARTMQTMRKTGEINALRVRSAVRYHRSTLREYIRARAREGVRKVMCSTTTARRKTRTGWRTWIPTNGASW